MLQRVELTPLLVSLALTEGSLDPLWSHSTSSDRSKCCPDSKLVSNNYLPRLSCWVKHGEGTYESPHCAKCTNKDIHFGQLRLLSEAPPPELMLHTCTHSAEGTTYQFNITANAFTLYFHLTQMQMHRKPYWPYIWRYVCCSSELKVEFRLTKNKTLIF